MKKNDLSFKEKLVSWRQAHPKVVKYLKVIRLSILIFMVAFCLATFLSGVYLFISNDFKFKDTVPTEELLVGDSNDAFFTGNIADSSSSYAYEIVNYRYNWAPAFSQLSPITFLSCNFSGNGPTYADLTMANSTYDFGTVGTEGFATSHTSYGALKTNPSSIVYSDFVFNSIPLINLCPEDDQSNSAFDLKLHTYYNSDYYCRSSTYYTFNEYGFLTGDSSKYYLGVNISYNGYIHWVHLDSLDWDYNDLYKFTGLLNCTAAIVNNLDTSQPNVSFGGNHTYHDTTASYYFNLLDFCPVSNAKDMRDSVSMYDYDGTAADGYYAVGSFLFLYDTTPEPTVELPEANQQYINYLDSLTDVSFFDYGNDNITNVFWAGSNASESVIASSDTYIINTMSNFMWDTYFSGLSSENKINGYSPTVSARYKLTYEDSSDRLNYYILNSSVAHFELTKNEALFDGLFVNAIDYFNCMQFTVVCFDSPTDSTGQYTNVFSTTISSITALNAYTFDSTYDYVLVYGVYVSNLNLAGENSSSYDMGFSAGQSAGYDSGYEVGYTKGKNTGYQLGIQESTNLNYGWLLSTVDSFLEWNMFGEFGVGTILGVLLGGMLLLMFLKFFAGG